MKLLEDFCLLCSDSCRSRAYIDVMLKNEVLPKYILYVKIDSVAQGVDRKQFETSLFDNNFDINELSKIHGLEFVTVESQQGINDDVILNALKTIKSKYTIFSIPGRILGKPYFELPTKYLHIHPGKLPEYRGSTPFYYSILKEGEISATALFLQLEIDQGPVIMNKAYPLPKKNISLDLEYDPWIRASLLIDVLNIYTKENRFPNIPADTKKGIDHYIIHPVLKCIAIKKLNYMNREGFYHDKG